ncbi:MAG: 2-oxo-4-hydroxy-4-carboxy-5-ureidoimidazoline decarboxylase [Alphaproteobacteria bacterium]|nr:2-oxo-4-hydroxy-4-carboxy-5-ureidoimidazoline decarboxylase [Alphaproteobacteria bacterium]
MTGTLRLADVNAADQAQFVRLLGHVFEHSPWVVEQAWLARPFASVDALHDAMMAVVRRVPRDRQIALLRAHPELAGREAQQGTLTVDSTSEQTRLGFHALSKAGLARMTDLNTRYREKFGFPCIIALRRHHERASVQAEHQRRLGNDADTEIGNCIAQIAIITRGRLDKMMAPA